MLNLFATALYLIMPIALLLIFSAPADANWCRYGDRTDCSVLGSGSGGAIRKPPITFNPPRGGAPRTTRGAGSR